MVYNNAISIWANKVWDLFFMFRLTEHSILGKNSVIEYVRFGLLFTTCSQRKRKKPAVAMLALSPPKGIFISSVVRRWISEENKAQTRKNTKGLFGIVDLATWNREYLQSSRCNSVLIVACRTGKSPIKSNVHENLSHNLQFAHLNWEADGINQSSLKLGGRERKDRQFSMICLLASCYLKLFYSSNNSAQVAEYQGASFAEK